MSYEIWERALELRGQKRFGSAVGHGTPFVFPAEIVASVLDKLITAHGNDGFAAWEDLHALSLTCRDLYHLVYSAMQYLGIPWDTTIDRMRFVYGKTRGEPYRERFMRRVRECLTNPDVACRELEESAKPIVEFADALSQLPAGFHVQDPQNYVPRVKDTHVKDTRVKDPRDIGGGCNTASFALAAASNIVHFAALAFSRGRESCHIISMPFSYSTGTRSDEWISALATDGRFVVNSEIVQDALIAICQVDCVPNIYSGQTNCDDDATDDAVCFDGYLWRSGQRVVGRRSLLEHPGHNLLGCSDAFSDFRFHAGLYRELEDHHTTESYRVLPMNAIRRWMTNLVNCDLETMVRNSGDDRAKDALRAELAKRPEFAELKERIATLDDERTLLVNRIVELEANLAELTTQHTQLTALQRTTKDTAKRETKRVRVLLEQVVELQQDKLRSYGVPSVHPGPLVPPVPSGPSDHPPRRRGRPPASGKRKRGDQVTPVSTTVGTTVSTTLGVDDDE